MLRTPAPLIGALGGTMSLIESLIKELGTVAIVVAAITFLAKTTISHFFTRSLDAHKATLDQRTETALASYRSSLEREQIRLQIAYGGVYQKQADTILELYQLLAQFERIMHFATNPTKESAEYKKFIEIWRRLSEVYEERQVLLPERIDVMVGEIAKLIFSAVHDIRRVEERIQKTGHSLGQQQFDRLFATQDQAYEVLNRIPEIKSELKAQMRRLLGVHHSQDASESDA